MRLSSAYVHLPALQAAARSAKFQRLASKGNLIFEFERTFLIIDLRADLLYF